MEQVVFRKLGKGEYSAFGDMGREWSIPKRQFQALYMEVGMFKLAYEMAKDLVIWPLDDKDQVIIPHDNKLRQWALEVDLGETGKIPDEYIKQMKKKADRYILAHTGLTLIRLQNQTHRMLDMMEKGEFDKEMNGTFGNVNTAWTFGLKELTNARGGAQVAKEMRVGNLQLNFGSVPKGIKARARKESRRTKHEPFVLNEPVLDGEYREVR